MNSGDDSKDPNWEPPEPLPGMSTRSMTNLVTRRIATGVVLQELSPIWQSLPWLRSQRYWAQAGVDVFRSGEVPYIVTNDGEQSRKALELYLASLRAAELRDEREDTSYVLELGVATGVRGSQFHRDHRYPGTRPVILGRFFALTYRDQGFASLPDQGLGLLPAPSPPRVSAPPLAFSRPEIQRQRDVAMEARAHPGRPGGFWTFGARAGGMLGMGDVRRATWGLEAALLARPGSGPTMVAGATVWPAQSGSWDETVALSIKIALARVGLCPLAWQWTSRELSVCAAFQAGRLTAEGSGLDTSFRQERWKLAVDAGASLTQRLVGGWGASVEARLIAPFRRDRVTVTDSTGAAVDLFRASPVGGAGIFSFGYWPELIRRR